VFQLLLCRHLRATPFGIACVDWPAVRIEIEPQAHSHSVPQVAYVELSRGCALVSCVHSRGFRDSAKWLRNEKQYGHDLRIDCVVSMA
jgi:hypothetical protein